MFRAFLMASGSKLTIDARGIQQDLFFVFPFSSGSGSA
jgi:hypothetical protein